MRRILAAVVALVGVGFTGGLAVTGLRSGYAESVGLFIPCAFFGAYFIGALLPAAARTPWQGGGDD